MAKTATGYDTFVAALGGDDTSKRAYIVRALRGTARGRGVPAPVGAAQITSSDQNPAASLLRLAAVVLYDVPPSLSGATFVWHGQKNKDTLSYNDKVALVKKACERWVINNFGSVEAFRALVESSEFKRCLQEAGAVLAARSTGRTSKTAQREATAALNAAREAVRPIVDTLATVAPDTHTALVAELDSATTVDAVHKVRDKALAALTGGGAAAHNAS